MRRKGIFIQPSLREKFHEISKLMIEAFAEQNLNVQEPNLLRWKWQKYAVLDKAGQTLIEALEREVHRRLWNSDSIHLNLLGWYGSVCVMPNLWDIRKN
jgi:hypothetical protein